MKTNLGTPEERRARKLAAFRNSGTMFCSCSAPRLPDELVSTTDEVYIRFHGRTQWYRHDYTAEELAEWVRRNQSEWL